MDDIDKRRSVIEDWLFFRECFPMARLPIYRLHEMLLECQNRERAGAEDTENPI